MVKLRCFMLLVLFFKISTCKPMNKNETMVYLTHFGYMKGDNETIYTEGIKRFQKYAGIEVTGEMDEQTQEVMTMPRCGSEKPETLKGQFQGSRWRNRIITYKILDYPKDLNSRVVDETIDKAFKAWSEFTNITFAKVLTDDYLINITFSYQPFMENMNMDFILGTAKYPIFGGGIYFNSLTNWNEDKNGISLYQATLHEIGHSLGLLHSSYPNSIMSPFLNKFDGNIRLHPNDKKKIKLLYGAPIQKIPSDDIPSICKIDKLDAIISYAENRIYVFSGDKYWLLEAWTDDVLFTGKYPKTISGTWEELPESIDAAFVDTNGDTYFFKEDEYWKYTEFNTLVSGYPKNITTDFPEIPNNLDAAMEWEDDIGETYFYFFKGAKYWKYDKNAEPPVSNAYPKSISEWGNHIPNDVDAVLYFSSFNGETYFFKDMLYYRYMETDVHVIRKFPRQTAFWWFHC